MKLSNIDYKEIPTLNEKEWKRFFLDEIFEIKGGKSITQKDMIEGNTPYISASSVNNALTSFIGNEGSADKCLITINANGSVGEAFYHPYECIVSADVKRLHLLHHDDNEFVCLFLCNIIKAQKEKYSYGYKFGEARMKRQIILLPVNETGEPDYEYM